MLRLYIVVLIAPLSETLMSWNPRDSNALNQTYAQRHRFKKGTSGNAVDCENAAACGILEKLVHSELGNTQTDSYVTVHIRSQPRIKCKCKVSSPAGWM